MSDRPGTVSFTLVELLVVCTILGVLLAGTVPAFRGSFRGAELRKAASDVAATLDYARTRAVCEECAYQVQFDCTANTYCLLGFSDPSQMEEGPESENTILKRPLPKEVQADTTDYAKSSGRFSVTFYPDGSADEGRIVLSVVKAGSGEVLFESSIWISGHDGTVTLDN